jgi:hypothetical protein
MRWSRRKKEADAAAATERKAHVQFDDAIKHLKDISPAKPSAEELTAAQNEVAIAAQAFGTAAEEYHYAAREAEHERPASLARVKNAEQELSYANLQNVKYVWRLDVNKDFYRLANSHPPLLMHRTPQPKRRPK